MEYFQATHLLTHKLRKLKIDILKNILKRCKLFVLYMSNTCRLFNIMCLVYSGIHVKCWIDAAKYSVCLLIWKENKSTKIHRTWLLQFSYWIFFIIIGYIELLVINLMFLSKWIYLNYSYQYSIFIVNPVYAVYFAVFTDKNALSNGLC